MCRPVSYLAKPYKTIDTSKYAVAIYSQTSNDNGDVNENKLGGSFLGFAYNILIPNVINGIVKSTAERRS